MTEQKTYHAINASAGSGKTYTLVQRVLMLCLAKPNQHDAIKHILALTFTNKAANEMKERILSWLKAFTKNNYAENNELQDIQKALKNSGINVELEKLHRRSQKVLDYILHHYSTLNIGTIDKFNSRLVRSFSYELGLSHQFNLEIQSEPFLIEAVDKMLDEIGEDGQISDAFMDFVNYNLDNDERISINKSLYGKAKEFVNDIHYDELKSNAEFDWDAYQQNKDKLRAAIKSHRETAKKLAEDSLNLIRENNLAIEDFAEGINGIGGFFKKFSENGFPLLYDSTEKEMSRVVKMRKGSSSKSKNRQADILQILDKLIESRSEIIKNFVQAEKKQKILRELLPLKINREIQDQLNLIEEENDIVLLSKFNVLINENLKNEPSAFIYEKIGTRYQHFFLDEFQDTSRMQWENIIPLRDHTITSDGSNFTIVGDPKQSIYRFRGGDSDLMLSILNKTENPPAKVNVEVLKNNYRSAKNIVNFNNELYEYAANDLLEGHRKLFAEDGKQDAKRENEGRVKVFLADYFKSSEPYFEETADQMHRAIQDCIDNGFKFKDITILCRNGKEIRNFAKLLGHKKVTYGGAEAYIRSISEKGLTLGLSHTLRALTEFLRWEIQPKNGQYPVKMLYHLRQTGRIKTEDFTEEMIQLLAAGTKEKTEQFICEKYGIKLHRRDFPNLNLYNYIEYFVHEFAVAGKETDFLLNFLEMLFAFTQNSGLTVKDFIKYWDEEGESTAIQASENIDAVKFMTIHAAKGLEFPVVFLPMRNSHNDGKFSDWLKLDGYDALKSVNIKGFGSELGNYDEDILKFNDENIYRNKIDRFCVQYVATTRPVEQLFLFIEKASNSNNYLEILDFVMTKKMDDSDEFDLYPEVGNSFKKIPEKEDKSYQKMAVKRLTSGHENIKNIEIATPSKNYRNTKESVRTGIFTHEILAKINSAADIDTVLESYQIAGEITTEERESISEKIHAIVGNPDYKKYFEPNLKVINEKDIMICEDSAKIYRPDRLVETPEGFYIIDFKTGARKEEHELQTAEYKKVLQVLGKKVLGTEVIYV